MNPDMKRLCEAAIQGDNVEHPMLRISMHSAEAIVRAVLTELREPSHQMMIAGDAALEVETDNPASYEVWRAMLGILSPED